VDLLWLTPLVLHAEQFLGAFQKKKSLTGQEMGQFLLYGFTFMTSNQHDFPHPEI
jgi:hypothetical protein